MPHFCADEVIAIMLVMANLPFIGPWVYMKISEWKERRRARSAKN